MTQFHLYCFQLWILRIERAAVSTTLFLYLKTVSESCAVSKGPRDQTLVITDGDAMGEATRKGEKFLENRLVIICLHHTLSFSLMLKERDTHVLFSPDSLLSA